MPYKPSAVQRMRALDDLHYEIQQLVGTLFPSSADIFVGRALLESRLLHVRNIIDFFGRSVSDNDDVLAAHYDFHDGLVRIDRSFDMRLNKDLAHLTYARTQRTLSDKPWPIVRVVGPVLERCDQFIDHLLRNRNVFAEIGPMEWRKLQLAIRGVLEAIRPRKSA